MKKNPFLGAFFAFTAMTSAAEAAYTKIANDGTELPAAAALGPNPTDWACTRDDDTGLIYEVETAANANVKYSLADANDSYPQSENAAHLCGYTDWRLPSVEELSNLLLAQSDGCIDAVDTTFFPNTVHAPFWSATTEPLLPQEGNAVDFCHGWFAYQSYAATDALNVRLVRGGKLFDKLPSAPTICQPVTFDFNVDAIPDKDSAWITFCLDPEFTVTVFDGSTAMCSSRIAADGTGSCSATFGLAGQRNLRFEYFADTDNCTSSERFYYRNVLATLTVKDNPAACVAGQYASSAPTANDCGCSDCGSGSFSTTVNAPACTACTLGTFVDTTGQTSCTPWSTCPAGSQIVERGSALLDRTCVACEPGTFTTMENQNYCAPYTPCEGGVYLATPGTPTADQTCSPCPAGTFNDQLNVPSCIPFTACAAGMFVSTAGTPTSDQVCSPTPMVDPTADAGSSSSGGSGSSLGADTDAGPPDAGSADAVASMEDDDGCNASGTRVGDASWLLAAAAIVFVRRRRFIGAFALLAGAWACGDSTDATPPASPAGADGGGGGGSDAGSDGGGSSSDAAPVVVEAGSDAEPVGPRLDTAEDISSYLEGKTFVMKQKNIPDHPFGGLATASIGGAPIIGNAVQKYELEP